MMEIKFFGANCFRLSTKHKSLLIDDNLASLGATSASKTEDVLLYTNNALLPGKTGDHFVISSPGEYEIGNIMVKGVATRGFLDEEGEENATIYKFIIENTVVVVLGHIKPDITEEVLEELGRVDVLLVPVGNKGYTLDPHGALKLINKIAPHVVVPTHYEQKGIKYEVPQDSLIDFFTEAKVEHEAMPSYKLKPGSVFEEKATQYMVLEP